MDVVERKANGHGTAARHNQRNKT